MTPSMFKEQGLLFFFMRYPNQGMDGIKHTGSKQHNPCPLCYFFMPYAIPVALIQKSHRFWSHMTLVTWLVFLCYQWQSDGCPTKRSPEGCSNVSLQTKHVDKGV